MEKNEGASGTGELGSNVEEGGVGNGEKDAPIEERDSLMHRLDVFTMQALRWHGEIVSEKSCLTTASFASKVFIKVKRSGAAHGRLTAVFFITEMATDTLLVYCLDKWYNVPFLKLPPPPGVMSREYWMVVAKSSLIMTSMMFGFQFAQGTSVRWFPDAVDVVSNATSTG